VVELWEEWSTKERGFRRDRSVQQAKYLLEPFQWEEAEVRVLGEDPETLLGQGVH